MCKLIFCDVVALYLLQILVSTVPNIVLQCRCEHLYLHVHVYNCGVEFSCKEYGTFSL